MRTRVRPILMAIAVTATATALSAGHAAAGGPTSVLVVNPATGETGALYATDSHYQVLQDSLAPDPDTWVEQPPQLSAGPGTPAINITWLAHDVSVWRVDHVRLDLKYVWVQTNVMGDDGLTPFDTSGDWHVAGDSDAVLDVLDQLGVLPETLPADGGGSAGESLGGTNESAGQPVTATPAPADPGWQWIVVAAVGGVALGAVGRPMLAAILRRREPGPRHQLVDGGSREADANPAEAPSLVLDLGDLQSTNLAR